MAQRLRSGHLCDVLLHPMEHARGRVMNAAQTPPLQVIRAKCSGKQSYWCGVDAKATAQAVEQCRHHIRDQSEDGIVWAENLVYRCAVPFVGSSH